MNRDNSIPAVDKTLALLERLGTAAPGKILKELGVSTSTGYRILQTLRKHRWLTGADGAGSGVAGFYLWLQRELPNFEHLDGVLEDLTHRTGLSCKLSVREHDEQVTVLRTEAPGPFGVSGKVGSRFPLLEGSVGAALVCRESAAELERLHAAAAAEFIASRPLEQLQAEVEELRRTGCALNAANRWRIVAVSAPVTAPDGRVIAALTVLGLPADFENRRIDELKKRIIAAAKRCSGGHNEGE